MSKLEALLQPKLNAKVFGRVPLQQFGYEQLKAEIFEFDPVANPSMPSNYFLGPGDEVLIHDSLGKNVGSLQGILVDPSGLVHIPGVRPIKAWNLTLEQFNKELQGKTKFLYATLGRLRSIQVNVVGEANRPGLHRVPAISSVYNTLALVGGVRKSGSLRHIHWKRAGKLVAEVDLYDYLLKGESLEEMNMKSGDTLFIPLLKNAVAVWGKVRRPGIYELDVPATLETAQELSGGLLPEANKNKVQIERSVPGIGRKLIRLSLADPETGREILQDHDVIKFFPNASMRSVKISGEVIAEPGIYPLLAGMRMSDLILASGGLDHPEATDFNVFITRWEHSSQESIRKVYRIQLDPMTLETKPLFQLKHEDSVLIRHHAEYRKPSFITLSGEVKFPGTYEFTAGDRLSTILENAGGFTNKAFLHGIVFTRVSLVGLEKAVDMRLSKDISQGLLQSTVSAPASLTSPETHLGAISAIQERVDRSQKQEIALGTGEDFVDQEAAKFQNINLGRLIIKIKSLEELKGTNEDVRLQDGDTLTVPVQTNTVLVKGETLGEASLPVVEGEDAETYIKQLGGLRGSADMSDVYVIQANGIVVRDLGYKIQAGDIIVAPPDLRPRESTLKEYATFIDIVFKTLTTIAVLYSVGVLQAPSAAIAALAL